MPMEPRAVSDGVIATGLVTSPAWGAWLGDVNAVLTMLTLFIGLVLGLVRLWAFFRHRE